MSTTCVRENALAWFNLYLSERCQYVAEDDTNSELLKVLCGVPQGSILGPLLFLILLLFCQMSLKDWNFNPLLIILTYIMNLKQKLILHITKLLDPNKFSINISKTNYVIFQSPHKSIPPDTSIKIGMNILSG